MTTDEMRSWLADIDHALRNGSRMTRANLSFERLCGALGVDPNALHPAPRKDLPADLRTKALAETATRLGYELGRKEAGEDIADLIEGMGEDASSKQRKMFHDLAVMARSFASRAPGAASKPLAASTGHSGLPEGYQGPWAPPQEPCEDPECPIALMHSHPEVHP